MAFIPILSMDKMTRTHVYLQDPYAITCHPLPITYYLRSFSQHKLGRLDQNENHESDG
jgi:hypothetical protein